MLARWQETASLLERARLGRRPAETLQEHAARLQSLAVARWLGGYAPLASVAPVASVASTGDAGTGAGLRPGAGARPGAGLRPGDDGPASGDPGAMTSADEIGAAVDAYERLAALAARAAYGPDACTFDEAVDAGQLGVIVRAGLVRPTRRREQPVPV